MLKFSNQPIETKLVDIHRQSEERDAKRRATVEKLPYINLTGANIDRSALDALPEALARETMAAAFASKNDQPEIAVYTSKNDAFEKLKLFLDEERVKANFHIASRNSLEDVWKHYSSIKPEERQEIVSEIGLSEGTLASKENIKTIAAAKEDIASIDPSSPTTEALTKILADALVLRASDIHIEPKKGGAEVRYRLDGSLYSLGSLDESLYNRVIGRLKLLANLKLNIKDQAQDGRFSIKRPGSSVEIRISVVPSEYGEAVVLRLLDPEAIALELNDLGLRQDDQEVVKDAIKRPNGMVLVTGPTGSGKTTTLYAFLKDNQSSESKIVTIEDPIEYHLTGIEQTQVNPEEGYNFASGLRSILRQDPDIIMIGEIRDGETAKTAIDASLTGHLVFSTLHTNNATAAIPRLIDLGIKPNSIPPSLNLVVAQRLVRRLCPECRRAAPITPEVREAIDKFHQSLPERVSRKAIPANLYTNQEEGCSQCVNGFRGRIGIFELLVVDEDMQDAMSKDVTEGQIRKLARQRAMVFMQEDGLLKAIAGITTIAEVEKATGPVNWPAATVK